MIIDLPYQLKAWNFFSKGIRVGFFSKPAIKDLILCLIIASIGLLGTYYLIRSESGNHPITTIEMVEIPSVVSGNSQ